MRKFVGQSLLIATHNQGKLAEFEALFLGRAITVISAKSLGLPEPAETEASFLGNARIKAHAAAQTAKVPALADDSGICVDGLGGAPGVYTADWAQTENGRDYSHAMARTWTELESAKAPYPRQAQFCCTLVIAWPDGHDEVFEGVVSGQLVWPTRGKLGHGYDPMFLPDGHSHTFAEMDEAMKNSMSHRAMAIQRLLESCFT